MRRVAGQSLNCASRAGSARVSVCPALRRGFTLIELMFGVIFTCMVLGALTALMLAMLDNWRDSRAGAFLPQWNGQAATVQTQQIASSQRVDCIDLLVKSARCIAFADRESSSSNSAVFLWATDASSAGTMQLGEVLLLEYDSTAHDLKMWSLPAGGPGFSTQLHYSDIDGSADVQAFKARAGIASQVLLRNVVDFAPKIVLNPVDASQRPALKYVLQIKQGSATVTRYQTVALRAPETNP